jgi:SET domain-containing protein
MVYHGDMTKEEIIKDLEQDIYCRIKKSLIEGVGVFAIKRIPKGTDPYAAHLDVETISIPTEKIMENTAIPEAVKELVKSFYVFKDGCVECPAHSFNEINISYFMNHSKNPNTEAQQKDHEVTFRTNRDIEIGEELTSDYDTFSDL